MSFREINSLAIDQYFDNNDVNTGDTFQLSWGNKVETYKVFEIPLDLLTYNFDNVRIFSDFRKYMRGHGNLDFENNEDRKLFAELFEKWLDKNTLKTLRDNILRLGQRDPAVITHDGILLDGNRRYLILKRLSGAYDPDVMSNITKDKIEAIRLPSNITNKELLKLQIIIQAATVIREPWKQINILLGIKKLQENGYQTNEIASFLDMKKTKVKKFEKDLKLIDLFLEKENKKDEYEIIDSVALSVDQFSELNAIESYIEGFDKSQTQKLKSKQLIKEVGLKLLKNNIDPAMIKKKKYASGRTMIRDLRTIIKNDRNIPKLKELLKLTDSEEHKEDIYDAIKNMAFASNSEGEDDKLLDMATHINEQLTNLHAKLYDPHVLNYDELYRSLHESYNTVKDILKQIRKLTGK